MWRAKTYESYVIEFKCVCLCVQDHLMGSSAAEIYMMKLYSVTWSGMKVALWLCDRQEERDAHASVKV